MKTELNEQHLAILSAPNLVYVKPLDEQELERILPADALEQWDRSSQVFALHNAEGDRVALVEGRDAAFAAARAHSLTPFSVH